MWNNIEDMILYEDRDIIVCHKVAGIAVQSARIGMPDMESTLKNYLVAKNPGKMPYLGVVHRLDQPVEGVLVFAKNKKAAAGLTGQITSGSVTKEYLAVTAQKVEKVQGHLEDYLKKDGKTNTSAVVTPETDGAKKAVGVAAACACAGIIVGIVTLTGLGLTFANLIISLAGGMLLPTLFLTMIASIILGMGLPTTAKYIVLATMAAPALVELGVPLIAAHLFILYFGVIADVTPPVALAAYAGAGIAGGDSFKTGIQALKLGSAGFIIPFIFATSPGLLLIDVTVFEAVISIITACVGVLAFASAVQGYFITHTKIYERIFFLAAALSLINPNIMVDIIGFVLLALAIFSQVTRSKKLKAATL